MDVESVAFSISRQIADALKEGRYGLEIKRAWSGKEIHIL